jgi:hypothetical protein
MNPLEIVRTMYDAVESGDLVTAGEYLADDAVLVLIPPPPGTDGTFVGKEAVMGWWKNLVQNNIAIELGDAEVSGNRLTMKSLARVDSLPIAPVEFDVVGIVYDGKLKAIVWTITPESMAELDAV